jgi:hypothetical protein
MLCMKKNTILLRSFVKEAIDLGDYEFAPDRLDLTPQQRAERNTEDEERLYTALRLRLDNYADIDKKTAKELSDLIGSKYGEKGSKFFHGPQPNTLLYRGDSVGEDWIKEHMPDGYEIPRVNTLPFLSKVLPAQGLITLKKPFVFRDRRGWSYTPDTTYGWAISYTNQVHYPYVVVYIINTNEVPKKSMIDFGHSMYKTAAGKRFQREQEVMNLKPITVKTVQIARWGSGL